MRILFATTLIPTAERSGGELVSLALIEALLQLGHEVIVAGYLRPGQEIADDTAIVVDHRPIETADSGARAISWLAQSSARNMSFTSAKFASRRYASVARNLCAEERVDAVIIDHTQIYWLRQFVPRHIPTALVMHNAESALYARGATQGSPSALRRLLYRREARLLWQVEQKIAASTDRIWTLTEADADRLPPNARSHLVALPVMPEWRGGVEHIRPTFDVGLLGTWTWEPNADALRWFLSAVRPHLPKSASIGVAGPGAEWLRGRDPRVAYLGFVDDAANFLRSANVIAVPTRYGSGVETKMLSAIATGRRVVATSTATRGLRDLPDTVAVADTPAGFITAIKAQLVSPQHARQDVAQSWWQTRRADFLRLLQKEMALLGAHAGQTADNVQSPVRERNRGFA